MLLLTVQEGLAMKLIGQFKLRSALLEVAGLLVVYPAGATSLTAQWFTVTTPDPDFETDCCNVYTNEIQSTLGPNGLPLYNPSYGGPTLFDVSGTGELTWWSPSLNPYVQFTGTSTLTLPINQNMFPPNGTGGSDSNGFQTAILTGNLVVPNNETVTFQLGSDDDSFLAIGNNVVAQVGGVHGAGSATYSTTLTAGTYLLTLFFADRQTTGAFLDFSVETADVTLTATTPLPAALPLMGTVLGAGWLVAHRRRRRLAKS
jgi:hypothetical protein